MFSGCTSLTTIPLLNTAAGTAFDWMFLNCRSLTSGKLTGTTRAISYTACKLSKTALEDIFDELGKASGAQTLTITNNWGSPIPISLSGSPTTGSHTVLMADTTGLEVGMQVNGTGMSTQSGASVSLTDSTDMVTWSWVNVVNGDIVWFSGITTTTGITTFTPYYVINQSESNFQLSLTEGGDVIPLTLNGTGFARVENKITAIDPNVSITLSRKAFSSTASTLSFRQLKTWKALSKGWTVSG
jgi:hypothetical protein